MVIDQLPGDPNLPPGCSNRDIDRRFREPKPTYCEECGRTFVGGLWDDLCPDCAELLRDGNDGK